MEAKLCSFFHLPSSKGSLITVEEWGNNETDDVNVMHGACVSPSGSPEDHQNRMCAAPIVIAVK